MHILHIFSLIEYLFFERTYKFRYEFPCCNYIKMGALNTQICRTVLGV